MGPYCKFCDNRCFVPDSQGILRATCKESTRLYRAAKALGWQGGTIHQVNEVLKIDALSVSEKDFQKAIDAINTMR